MEDLSRGNSHQPRGPDAAGARVGSKDAQHLSIFAQMIKGAFCGVFVRRAEKINVKQVFPGLSLQRTRLDFGQVDITQRKDTQGLE